MEAAPEDSWVDKTYRMVSAGHPEIGWSNCGSTVVVNNSERLAREVLPHYFGNLCQYTRWVRGLNGHEFRKCGGGQRWSHTHFHRDFPQHRCKVKRKKAPSRGRPGRAAAMAHSTAIVPLMPIESDEARSQRQWLEQRFQEVSQLQSKLDEIKRGDESGRTAKGAAL